MCCMSGQSPTTQILTLSINMLYCDPLCDKGTWSRGLATDIPLEMKGHDKDTLTSDHEQEEYRPRQTNQSPVCSYNEWDPLEVSC